MSMLLKAVHRLNANLIKILGSFCYDIDQTTQELIQRHKKPRIVKEILNGIKTTGAITCFDCKLQYRTKLLKTKWHRPKTATQTNITQIDILVHQMQLPVLFCYSFFQRFQRYILEKRLYKHAGKKGKYQSQNYPLYRIRPHCSPI